MLWKILKVFVLFEIFNTLKMSDDLADMYKDDCYDIDLDCDLDCYNDFYDNFYYDDDFDDYDVDAEIYKDIAVFDEEWDVIFNNYNIDDFDEFGEDSDDDDFVDIGDGKLLKLESF